MTILYDIDKFTKGKHQGETVQDVCLTDPQYIKQFNSLNGKRRVDNYAVSDEVIKSLSYARR